jgi:AmmeMemoRadiSam system protein A
VLTDHDRRQLLRLARAAIEEAVTGDGSLARALGELVTTEGLASACGVFVTVKTRSEGRLELRGCLGNTEPELSLHHTVPRLARDAATRDPRFPPVRAAELRGLHVEISVLGRLERLERTAELVLGIHGVQMRKGDAVALFLPQVAAEQGWSVEQLLGHLAQKAGLPESGWRDAELSIFRCECFGESER